MLNSSWCQFVTPDTLRSYFGNEVVRWTPDSRNVPCKTLSEEMMLEDTLDLISDGCVSQAARRLKVMGHRLSPDDKRVRMY